MACGTPLIALRRGGAAESVTGLESEAPTGVFFEEQSVAAVVGAVRTFEEHGRRISAAACRARAERYSAERFRKEFADFIAEAWARWNQAPGP
jgi:glycosyltransferase involved in cell wall biosynthesis